jgi:hypothetical protein
MHFAHQLLDALAAALGAPFLVAVVFLKRLFFGEFLAALLAFKFVRWHRQSPCLKKDESPQGWRGRLGGKARILPLANSIVNGQTREASALC